MVILQEIEKRRSPLVFQEDDVEKHKIEAIVEAARWAPSCFNKQPWKYVFVHKRDLSRAIAGESIFIIDFSSFMISVVIGQLVGYKLLTYRKLPKVLDTIALLALVLLAVCFAVFTFYAHKYQSSETQSEGDMEFRRQNWKTSLS